IVIAAGFSTDIAFSALGLAGAGLGLVLLLRFLGVRSVLVYVLAGAGVWLAFLKSGVHPTVAGALLGLLPPARPGLGRRVVSDLYARLLGHQGRPQPAPEGVSPLEWLEGTLHPWVAFGIMPLFALANAGVAIELSALATPVALGVAIALTVGKPAGIVLFSW